MLCVVLVLLYCFVSATTATTCDPTTYLCSARCPPIPEGRSLGPGNSLCMRDVDSGACICWLNNPNAQLHSLFQCEVKVNGSISKLLCRPPSYCFEADPSGPGCLIVTRCPCTNAVAQQQSGSWRPLRATLHTASSGEQSDVEDRVVEKVPGDVREFSLKHLLFLIGFVIAPLFCWCLLNFFHEGKCRKKPALLPEAQPMPISRSSTVDCCDADEDISDAPDVAPSAPDASDAREGQANKCESPPPYTDNKEHNYAADCGPPPSYEDAMQGRDASVHHIFPTVCVHSTGPREMV